MTINRNILAGAMAVAASLWLASPGVAEIVSPQAVACKLIRNAAQLQAIRNDLASSYCLANDIDAGSIANFVPIGDGNGPFTGKLFGNGRVIRNLTIESGGQFVGLFGLVENALIQDARLANANIAGTGSNAFVGGLVGLVLSGSVPSEIRRVRVTGRVAGAGGSRVGGIAGDAHRLTLADSWSSAAVNGAGSYHAGGAIGAADVGTVRRVYATGAVTCAGSCNAGGLIGDSYLTSVDLSYASGPVIAGDSGNIGGLVGSATNSSIQRSHALGAVTAGGGSACAGGLIGRLEIGTLAEVYAAGRVTGPSGATLGGLIGVTVGAPSISNAYWDVNTSAQAGSAEGIGYPTSELRSVLPPGFSKTWASTTKRSYPFLDDADIDFAAPLATLVKNKRVYTFLPIDQHDASQYAEASTGANAASLAAVYTMIARAIGITRNVAKLNDVRIDKYFWNDATRITTWRGPVTARATLGPFTTIAANVPLNGSNVIGAMKSGKLVILRGTYTRSNGAKAEHWLLGTLYTASGNEIGAVVANDPWTGGRVMIDPTTKKIVAPASFTLASFKVDGYQSVTLN